MTIYTVMCIENGPADSQMQQISTYGSYVFRRDAERVLRDEYRQRLASLKPVNGEMTADGINAVTTFKMYIFEDELY